MIGSPLTLLGSIVLVRLAVPLPYVAIKVIEIVGGDVRNAVQLKEVSLRGQSPENEQQPPHDRQATGRPRRCSDASPPFILSRQDAGGGPNAEGSVRHSHGSRGGALGLLVGYVWRFAADQFIPPTNVRKRYCV